MPVLPTWKLALLAQPGGWGYLLGILLASLFIACTPKSAPRPTDKNKSQTSKPKNQNPVDTVRWQENTAGKPPITSNGKPSENPTTPTGGDFSKQKFRIALLLPLLTNQAEAAPAGVPERSAKAIQFYAGAKLALAQLSEIEGMNLTVDVLDTQLSDADFAQVLKSPKLDLADVFIGPFRSSHVEMLGKNLISNRKIIVSPESPNEALVSGNPNFLQLNPSLRTHCEAMLRHVRAKSPDAEIVLIAREKERERLDWIQNLHLALGGAARLAEYVLPDATTSLAKTDLSKHLRAGRKTVFLVPSFSSQDFVFAVFRQVKTQMGKAQVEVFGLPQWQEFENIEADFFEKLRVHITAASFTDFAAAEVKTFAELFYQTYSTVPNDDAFNGYDAVLFTGKMLKKYGLAFPEKSTADVFHGIHASVRMGKIFAAGGDGRADYLENKFLHVLRFEDFQFRPAE